MLFSGITFLYYFLPVTLLAYAISPKPLKNTVLLIFSLIFYGWGEPVYVFLMAATIILGYIFGVLIEKFRGKPLSKVFCIVSVAISLSFLLYFKYADFFITNFNYSFSYCFFCIHKLYLLYSHCIEKWDISFSIYPIHFHTMLNSLHKRRCTVLSALWIYFTI